MVGRPPPPPLPPLNYSPSHLDYSPSPRPYSPTPAPFHYTSISPFYGSPTPAAYGQSPRPYDSSLKVIGLKNPGPTLNSLPNYSYEPTGASSKSLEGSR